MQDQTDLALQLQFTVQQLTRDLQLANEQVVELQHKQPIIEQEEELQQVPLLLEEEPDDDDEPIVINEHSLKQTIKFMARQYEILHNLYVCKDSSYHTRLIKTVNPLKPSEEGILLHRPISETLRTKIN